MPFPTQTPIPFTRSAVQALDPALVGCYGIFNQSTWIYVGKGEIRARLLAHLNGDAPCLRQHGATHLVIEQTLALDAREKQLIDEFRPVCNERIG
jgi:hypothetical protein